MISAWIVATEGHVSTLRDIAAQIRPTVDRVHLVPGSFWASEVLKNRAQAMDAIPAETIDVSHLNRDDWCVIVREGLVYPGGFVRRMMEFHDDIRLERKIIGVEGVIYSDFYDGKPASRLFFGVEDALEKHLFVNQLALNAVVVRAGDLKELAAIDLKAPGGDIRFAIECFAKGIPHICVERGGSWLGRHNLSFGDAEAPLGEQFVSQIQQIAGFSRLPNHLPNAGVPVRSNRSRESLIANERFAGVVPGSAVRRMWPFAPYWYLDFLGNPNEFSITISHLDSDEGARIVIDRAPRGIRLLAPIDPSAIGAGLLHAEFSLRSESRNTYPPIDGIYVLSVQGKQKPRILERIFGTIETASELQCHSRNIRLPRVDPQSDTFLCIQLGNAARFIEIKSASLVATAASQQSFVEREVMPSPGPRIKAARRAKPVSAAPASRAVAVSLGSRDAKTSEGKPRMLITCSNLGQNAFGRAYNLAEIASREYQVELLGALSHRPGGGLWAPLRDSVFPVRGIPAPDTASYFAALDALSDSDGYDFIYVSKPKLASLVPGMLLSARCGCPLLLDIDDPELAFLKNSAPLSFDELKEAVANGVPDIDTPGSELWTRFCDGLFRDADAVTVSNSALQGRFGGTIVRHARDETRFVPDEDVRRDVRREFGIRHSEKVVFFLGTPRDHKGLVRLARSIARRADPDLTMCVMGFERNRRASSSLEQYEGPFVRLFGPQPYERLPQLIQCADAVSLLQDPSSAISGFQSPAKLGEAFAMGLPVLTSRVAPLTELIEIGAAIPVDTDAELEAALDGVRDGRFSTVRDRDRRIAYFRAELSIARNFERLLPALELARRNRPVRSAARLETLRKLASIFEAGTGNSLLNLQNSGSAVRETAKVD